MLNTYDLFAGDEVTRVRDGMKGEIVMVYALGSGGLNMYGPPPAVVRWESGLVETIGDRLGMLNPECVEAQ